MSINKILESVPTTYRMLKEKACNADIDEIWVEWAIQMIQAGYEFDSLYQLAGIAKPYNQLELHDLTNEVLNDLQLDCSDKYKTFLGYIYFTIKQNLNNNDRYYKILEEFKDIYFELDMDSDLQKFALLYWAKEYLLNDSYQHYWDGADKTNIDKIIKEQFELYISRFDVQK